MKRYVVLGGRRGTACAEVYESALRHSRKSGCTAPHQYIAASVEPGTDPAQTWCANCNCTPEEHETLWPGSTRREGIMKCPNCNTDAGLPPYTCSHCGAIVTVCPNCKGHGTIVSGWRRNV